MTALTPVPMPFDTVDDSLVNLRELIRDTAKSFPGASWKTIAGLVAANVPADQLRAALEQALAPMVREVVTHDRPRGPIARPFDSPATPPPPAPSPSPAPARPMQNIGGPSPIRSGGRKGSEIRDAWQKVLDAEYATEHGRKQLGDCTYDDLQFMAAQLDQQAESFRARARGFRGLAALMTDHDVQNLRDLPSEVLMQALGAK